MVSFESVETDIYRVPQNRYLQRAHDASTRSLDPRGSFFVVSTSTSGLDIGTSFEPIELNRKKPSLFQFIETTSETSTLAETDLSFVNNEIQWFDYIERVQKIEDGKYTPLIMQANVLRSLVFQKLGYHIGNPQISKAEDGGLNLTWHVGNISLSFDLLFNGTYEWFARNHSTGVYDGADSQYSFDFINNERLKNFFSLVKENE